MLLQICVKTNNIENIEHIGYISNVLCEIILATDDVQILQKGSAFLKLYIPLSANSKIIEKLNQKDIILKTILKYFSDSVLETGTVYLGNVIAQYFFHIDRKLDINILESLINRIYKVIIIIIFYNKQLNTYIIL